MDVEFFILIHVEYHNYLLREHNVLIMSYRIVESLSGYLFRILYGCKRFVSILFYNNLFSPTYISFTLSLLNPYNFKMHLLN